MKECILTSQKLLVFMCCWIFLNRGTEYEGISDWTVYVGVGVLKNIFPVVRLVQVFWVVQKLY